MFAAAHPIEAHAHDPERFWQYFHKRAPNVTREQMVALLKECEDPPDQFQACPDCNSTRVVIGTVVQQCPACGDAEFDMKDLPYHEYQKAKGGGR